MIKETTAWEQVCVCMCLKGEEKKKTMATWFIVEVDSNCLHPSIVSVPGIVHIAFKNLEKKKGNFILFLYFIMDPKPLCT